jgi:CPA2 family monovalent cation:H+ antiporter-2
LEELGLVGDLAVVGAAALIGGSMARVARLPTILGYLAAGMVIGPNTPGFVGDVEETRRIADLGVALLMFTIGVRLSPRELVDAGWLVGVIGLAQVGAVLLVGASLSGIIGLGATDAFVFGGAAAISSTMIALRQLEDAGEIEAPAGKMAIGISVVQDLAAVPMIVIIPALASGDDPLPSIGLAAVRGVALVAGVSFVGRFVAPRVLWTTARWRSRELFLLSVLVLALGTASISSFAGLSLAFGAFLAGLLISESELAHRTLSEVFPLREIFAVVFFVAVGMLVDPESFTADPELVFGILAVGLAGKVAILAGLAWVFGVSARAALTTAIALGQMGEFSFIFASVALEEGLFSVRENGALLAGIVLSMAISPLLFTIRQPLITLGPRFPQPRWISLPPATLDEPQGMPMRHHIVVCGYNEAARHVVAAVRERFTVIVVHDDLVTVRRLREDGVAAVLGDPSLPTVLEQASINTAQVLVVVVYDVRQAQAIVRQARLMNERLDIITRGGGLEFTRAMLDAGASQVVEPELEAGLEFLRHTLHRMGLSNMEIQAILRGRRRRFISGQR